jgi:hypothetical protein
MSSANTESLWLDALVAARSQTIDDLSVCGLASVSVMIGDAFLDHVADRLADAALEDGFAVATASIDDQGIHDLDALVRALARSLRMPDATSRHRGVPAALKDYAEYHGRRTRRRFEEAADEEGLDGELRFLAHDYLQSIAGKPSARRLNAWLAGKDVTPSADELALQPLSARTAKRALSQLSRLVRALGAWGLRLILSDADALVSLSRGRRDVAYGVLRELCDNGDGWHGMVGVEVILLGSSALEKRAHALHDHAALASRVLPPNGAATGPTLEPFPHQSWVRVPEVLGASPAVGAAQPVEGRRVDTLRSLVRAAQGLPPVEAVPELTVGVEDVDKRIDRLFAHAENDGSMFAVLSGAYGAGKTHNILFFESRALAARRPVFRLGIERLDQDLGNPQRHLRRMLEGALLPGRRRVGPLDRLDVWLASDHARRRLSAALRAAVDAGEDSARAAERALRGSDGGVVDPATVIETLGALDLVDKPAAPTYRKDAYERLHLWIHLLERLDGCEGPVIILDEAENLYRAGVSRSERRTALRSLGFYCSGAIERACVILAVTPDSLEQLRDEAGILLDEIEHQATLLPQEDVALLRRRLLRARPIRVARLGHAGMRELAERAVAAVADVRSKPVEIDSLVDASLRDATTPREALRRAVLAAESSAWLR